MVGVGFCGGELSRQQFVGAALDRLSGRAEPTGCLRDGEGLSGEDAQRVPQRLRLACLSRDVIGDSAMLIGIIFVWLKFHSLDFAPIFHAAKGLPNGTATIPTATKRNSLLVHVRAIVCSTRRPPGNPAAIG